MNIGSLLRKIATVFAPTKPTRPAITEPRGLLLNGQPVVVIDSSEWKKVNVGNWHVGEFRIDEERGLTVSLGMRTDLYNRDGSFWAPGWDGNEENVGCTAWGLQRGDTMKHASLPGETSLGIELVVA